MWFISRWRASDAARVVTALLIALACAHAATASGNDDWTPENVRKVLAPLLAGEARFTWFGFHVYDARLFVAPTFNVVEPVAQPFVLELTYARSLAGKAIAETSRDEIARLGFGTEEKRRRWFEQMASMFPDVQRGRCIEGVNVPDRGVRFYIDGRAAGNIDDTEFAHAFFAIWLDSRTRSPKVREGLLRDVAHN